MVLDDNKRPSNWAPLYIGHRGFRIGVVENTLTAFQQALEFKMDYIELDIHRSKDNILYVLYDSDISRTMRAKGVIEEKLSEELDQVMTYTRRENLPRLTAVFDEILTPENETTKLMIGLNGEDTGKLVCELVKVNNLEEKIIFNGGNLEELTKAHELLPNIPICLDLTNCEQFTFQNLYGITEKEEFPLPFHMISMKATFPFHLISLNSQATELPEKKFVATCHKWDIQALSWNFMVHNTGAFLRMTELMKLGMDGFLFDDPRSVVAIRDYFDDDWIPVY